MQLPHDAAWRAEFISEATQFPYGPFDDQVDALSQYLDWIAEHPNLKERPPRAICQGADSQGRPLRSSWSEASIQAKGIVVQLGSRGMFNAPFRHF